MNSVCFVILHYNATDDTIECIESITSNLQYQNKNIVVVDNNSPNQSGYFLKEKYKENKDIYFILNESNIGFASGNNVGYKFAVEHLKANFVVIINNDTIINDPNFIKKIIDLYNKEKFHIMGPDIIAKDGYHQNPYKISGESLDNVKSYLKNYKLLLYKEMAKAIIKKVKLVYIIIKSLKKVSNKTNLNAVNKFDYRKSYENVVLHGSALIFSPLFITNEKNAFHPGTFMFMEEDILYYLSRQKNYKMLYSPITSIYHKEDAATDTILKSDTKKIEFKYKHQFDSYLILKKVIEENECK